MVSGTFSSGMMPVQNGKKAAPAKGGAETESFITVELRTASVTAMRIQGSMAASHLRDIISAG